MKNIVQKWRRKRDGKKKKTHTQERSELHRKEDEEKEENREGKKEEKGSVGIRDCICDPWYKSSSTENCMEGSVTTGCVRAAKAHPTGEL